MVNRFEKRHVPEDELERLIKLRVYNPIGDYELSGTFQHVARMAARLFQVPIGIVSFVEDKCVAIGASVGLGDMIELERDLSLCSMAILRDGVTVFENAKVEPTMLTNPYVHGALGLSFYAAAPLISPDGYKIGAVSVADKKPRSFSVEEESLLTSLASIVMDELEERQSSR